jgi:[acyl-carrier-protein] S-malonyltransferase
MGRPWREHPSWELVDHVSDTTGRDARHLLLEAGAEELTETRNSQVATFALSMVALDAVQRLGVAPALCAGHSLGEYTALVASGALGFEDGAKVVAERAEAMQLAADDAPGTMAAVLGLEGEMVEQACRRVDHEVWVANYNAPGQVVIAGSHDSVASASAEAKDLGARRVLAMHVGGAFHTPFMEPARDRLRKALAGTTLETPRVPVVANVDARPYADAGDWPSLLSSQLCSPVRWHQSLLRLAADGVTTVIELGPGAVLTGLARRTVPNALALSVSTPDHLDKLVDALAGDSPLHTYAAQHPGEHLYMSERLVVSPGAGVFVPHPEAAAPRVEVGSVLGVVGNTEVRSPFAGSLMGMLAVDGERVQMGQPIAWLRSA